MNRKTLCYNSISHKNLFKHRAEIEKRVISCILNDPLLIYENNTKCSYFVVKKYALYFNIVKNVRKKGIFKIDENSLTNNIHGYLKTQYLKYGGWKSIKKLIDSSDNKNWNTYIDMLYRENLIVMLYNDGFNLKKVVKIKGKNRILLDVFKTLDFQSVIDWYDKTLSNYTCYFENKPEEWEFDIDLEGIYKNENYNYFQFKNAGKDSKGNEIKCFPLLYEQIGGFRESSVNVIAGNYNNSKIAIFVSVIFSMIECGRRILIISNSSNINDYKYSIIMWLIVKYLKCYSISKKELENGEIKSSEIINIKAIKQYWNENYNDTIKIICFDDYNIKHIKNKIRENILQYGYDTILFDCFKFGFCNLCDDIKEIVNGIKELCATSKKYDIITFCYIQISAAVEKSQSSTLLNEIKEFSEVLLYLRKAEKHEIENIADINYNKLNQYSLLDIIKSSNGINTNDTGMSCLFELDSLYGIIDEKELYFCNYNSDIHNQ